MSVQDPTKYVRKMYVNALEGIIKVYDGMAPADATGIYAVMDTAWTREGAKNCNYYRFTVNLEINQEFKEYGNSEGVDGICDDILELMMPLNSSGYLTVVGFSQDEITLESGSNDAFQNDALVVFRKTITINHFLSEN